MRIKSHYFWVSWVDAQKLLKDMSDGHSFGFQDIDTAIFEQDVLDLTNMSREDARREFYERGGSN